VRESSSLESVKGSVNKRRGERLVRITTRYVNLFCLTGRQAHTSTFGRPGHRVLVIWPEMLTVECVVNTVEFQYRQFGVDGQVLGLYGHGGVRGDFG
jgi:hypothetical protein